jgi:hypothetical protein
LLKISFPKKNASKVLKCRCNKQFNTVMDANSLTAVRFKAQVNKFSGILSRGLAKTKKRFFKEVLYGLQAGKDIKLSNISRALMESIPLIKTENRLSRNLDDADFSEHINAEILRLGHRHITPDMVIAIDPGDICKPYAKAMENLCAIYDGTKKEGANGYHLCQVTGANLQHNKIVPLHCELYSTAEGLVKNNAEKIMEIIDKVSDVIGQTGTWAIDREGDNKTLIEHFINRKLTFITRLRANRFLHFGGNDNRQVAAERLCKHTTNNYRNKIIKIQDGRETQQIVTYSSTSVCLPDLPGIWLQAVIVEGWGEIPMVLITNQSIDPENPFTLWRIVEAYLTRWKCDECYRYIKQSYNTEDVRVRSYNGLRNMIAFVHAIAYFTSIFMGISLKLKIMVEKIFVLSKRFFNIPNFFNYAMADGIYNLLKSTKSGINTSKNKEGPPDLQLSLIPD